MNIGFFEPMLLLALMVAAYHSMESKIALGRAFPWRAPLLVFGGWQAIGLLWAYRATTGLQEVVAVGIVLATTTLILAFVTDLDRFGWIVRAWVVASVLVGVLSMATNLSEVATTGQTWEVASGGGRETGVGQQPNRFAMNLMFGVLTAFAVAMNSTRRLWKVLLLSLESLFSSPSCVRDLGWGLRDCDWWGTDGLANPVFRDGCSGLRW